MNYSKLFFLIALAGPCTVPNTSFGMVPKLRVAERISDWMQDPNQDPTQLRLREAIIKGNIEKVSKILEATPAALDGRVKWETPLSTAIHYDQAPILQLLIEKGALKKVSIQQRARYFLSAVCSNVSLKTIATLLKNDPNVTEYDKAGKTVFHYCAQHQHKFAPYVATFFAQKIGADFPTRDGQTALHLTAEEAGYIGDSCPIIEALLKCGANPNAVTSEGFTPLDIILRVINTSPKASIPYQRKTYEKAAALLLAYGATSNLYIISDHFSQEELKNIEQKKQQIEAEQKAGRETYEQALQEAMPFLPSALITLIADYKCKPYPDEIFGLEQTALAPQEESSWSCSLQ